jgi:uncharacterized membrane protein YeiB
MQLAESVKEASPVQEAERINSLDVPRGTALMGKLIVKINEFVLPAFDHSFPLTTVKHFFSGPHSTVNTGVWFTRWISAEGKMRRLSSTLYCAGVMFLIKRAEGRCAAIRTVTFGGCN